jgi:hypothetical protein
MSVDGLPRFAGWNSRRDLDAARRQRAVAPGLRPALIRQAVLLVILAILAAPAITPLAGWVRWTFPIMAALLAGGLALRNQSATYVTACSGCSS